MDYEKLRQDAKEGSLSPELRKQLLPAAQGGDSNAQYLLACSEPSRTARLKWLKAAAAQGHPEACADLYDLKRDTQWLRRSAELGWAPAQKRLGQLLATGNGRVTKNLEEARRWYLESSRLGYQEAWYEMAFMFLLGEGGPADPAQAVEWLEKAAASEAWQADDAARLLSDLLNDGSYGVTKDAERSRFWRERYDSLEHAQLDWHAANIHHLTVGDGPDSPASQANGFLLVRFTQRYADLELAQVLLSRGADPNVPLDGRNLWPGSTALSWSTGNPELVKLLVAAGARVSAECTQNKIISLHAACHRGDLDIVRLLIEHAGGAAALLLIDQDQATPLIHAAYAGHLPVVHYLLHLGLEVNAPAEESALEVALRQNHHEVAELIRSFGD